MVKLEKVRLGFIPANRGFFSDAPAEPCVEERDEKDDNPDIDKFLVHPAFHRKNVVVQPVHQGKIISKAPE